MKSILRSDVRQLCRLLGKVLIVLTVLGGALLPEVNSVTIRPRSTNSTSKTTKASRLITLSTTSGLAANASSLNETSPPNATVALDHNSTDVTTATGLVKRLNCTEKERQKTRCVHGQCYVTEHDGMRTAAACECLESYKGATCKFSEPPSGPSLQDTTESQKVVGIIVPVVALVVTAVVVLIMCRMKIRRAACSAGSSGVRSLHSLVSSSADSADPNKELKAEDTPLIANGSSSVTLGVPSENADYCTSTSLTK